MEGNEELEATYIAADAKGALGDQQKTDIEKTECEQKLKAAKHLIQDTLWTSYGEKELSLALQIAEAECDNVTSTEPQSLEAYDFMLTHLEKLVHKAKGAHQTWSRWAPPAEKQDFNFCLMELEICLPKLVSGKAALIKAANLKEDTGIEPTTAHSSATAGTIKLKATALPKFTGCQHDFYRWKKDWEALQNQGEPTGSRELKKFQLLYSLDEKDLYICQRTL
ncbi:uncharacterized protein LOC124881465 isoform X2 [Girardinichthys multiradiatus]|uniref:uncharacterized protein LOC124881465 isoform X2 n=1 Tax=Girardinichthys multiradiatus TaxID=208333 RepID=UPI001FAC2D7F|nr:uncharacterized protein LOC124881465 isoform X2 [Girardinichthys multiradiatus]